EEGGFDVIVANILHEPLLNLAPTLAVAAVPGAKVCLTGLRSEFPEELQDLQSAFEEFDLQRTDLSAGWCLLEGK
ncbi:Ribosomal protein L11 methyltransferase (L11 Mtase), partial [Durusdinium trenchii]